MRISFIHITNMFVVGRIGDEFKRLNSQRNDESKIPPPLHADAVLESRQMSTAYMSAPTSVS